MQTYTLHYTCVLNWTHNRWFNPITIKNVIFRCIAAEDAHRSCSYIVPDTFLSEGQDGQIKLDYRTLILKFPFVCRLKSVKLIDSNDHTFHCPNVSSKSDLNGAQWEIQLSSVPWRKTVCITYKTVLRKKDLPPSGCLSHLFRQKYMWCPLLSRRFAHKYTLIKHTHPTKNRISKEFKCLILLIFLMTHSSHTLSQLLK